MRHWIAGLICCGVSVLLGCGSDGEDPTDGSGGSGGVSPGGTGGVAGEGGTGGSGGGAGSGGASGSGGGAGSGGASGSGGGAGSGGSGGIGGSAGAAGSAGMGGSAGVSGSGGQGAVPWLAGVNLAGAEFGEGNLPGEYGTHYIYPSPEEVDYFVGKGMNAFRLPFRWERLQPALDAAFDGTELSRIDDFVDYAVGKGAWVLLDPHNYARYHGDVIGESNLSKDSYADFWSRLADHFGGNDHVVFGLMNEPQGMATELWLEDANAAIAAIRAAGAGNLILVPGNGYTGAHSWTSSWYGTPNADVMGGVVDPANNFAFEMHQYLDGDSSGTSETCVSETVGSERLESATAWLEQNGHRAFLGELGGARNDTCYAALDDMLTYLEAHDDVWMGWTYWAAGPWWGEYMFTIEPVGGQDRPQMDVLESHL